MPLKTPALTLSYKQIRLAWCRMALVSLLRRWGIYLLVGVFVLGGAGSHAVAAMTAIAAWSVLPLFQAAQQSVWQALLMILAYALVGAALVWGLTPVLWPRAWAEAERALPLAERERRLSDLTVVALGLIPLFAVYFTGTIVWLVTSPPWLDAIRGRALAMLVTSMALSVALGVALLWWWRDLPIAAASARPRRHGALSTHRQQPLSITMALVLLPMWRGPARRVGRFFVVSLLTLLACDASLAAWPLHASWWLAAFAAFTQTLTTRLNVLAARELGALHDACTALPLTRCWLRRARHTVALVPLGVGASVLLFVLLSRAGAVDTRVLTVYFLALLIGNAALLVAANTTSKVPPEADPAARVSWWLLILVIQLALASEVMI